MGFPCNLRGKHIESFHEELKKHECSYCDYKTNNQSTFKHHVDGMHDANKEYFCDQCDFKTNWENYLKMHKRAEHLGKTFSCPHCEYSSKYKLNVKNHIRGSHSNKRHPCHQCAKEFKWVQALKQHIDCAHEGLIFSTKIKHINTHKEKEVLKLHTKYLDIMDNQEDVIATDMETVGSSYTVVDEITKGVTEERLARTEAGGRLKRKKD